MSRIAIFGYYGQDNAGDEAILSALASGIKRTNPEAVISACSAKPEETKKSHGIDAFNYFSLAPKAIIKGLLRRSRLAYLKSIFTFFKADLIIIGGGGLYFDTKETNKWIFGYINLIHLAKKFGKKVALVGISVGPLHHQGSKDAIAAAFVRADLITVRDNLSKELLTSLHIPEQKINVIPDLVFTFNSAPEERVLSILKDEGINKTSKKIVSLVPCCYNMEKEGWLEQYVNLCEKILEIPSTEIWMVPLQRHETFDDYFAANTIYNGLNPAAQKKCTILQKNYAANEIQGILSSADFVFAERLHGSIMALNTNTPFLGIAYMQKVSGVLELANLPERIISIEHFLSGGFFDSTYEAINSELSENTTSHSLNDGIRAKAQRNFDLLKQLITTKN
ncbi:polysaccharide pyruvyl transferase CsaB [Cellvibrio zantedeschiae]|uniref:Polysaccharide pyruvyl transferase CsaB n=1 Tax=Cellvibrio zantedeschiae TaxID=1237077 RepID=A0ABQ3B8C6_9GAMM|nr:polysaccharide pyruvyl transferase family protein [Cellvibrio zantedeschiae]GGY82219.1 polysaccharide pyruvyl transferase CsaB [Cellvibrio zantedeschiae]